ncbi:MAG: hypothetical protein AB8B55_03455 [Mariniblastus sp.]
MSIEPSKSEFSNRSNNFALAARASLSDKSACLTIGLIAVPLNCNWQGAIYFYDPMNSASFRCIAIGMLVVQACLIAIWFAMGKQIFIIRASLTFGILLILSASFSHGIVTADPVIPMEIPIMILAVAIGLFLIIQTPLWIYRRSTCQVISRSSSTSNLSAEQFSIKHLLIATTIAAVLFAAGRFFIPDLEYDGGAPIGAISHFVLSYAVLVALLSFLCVGFVFVENKRVVKRIAIGVAITLTILLVPAFFYMVMKGRIFSAYQPFEGIFYTVIFSCSLTATMLVVLFAYRSLGFRLRTVKAT